MTIALTTFWRSDESNAASPSEDSDAEKTLAVAGNGVRPAVGMGEPIAVEADMRLSTADADGRSARL